ncbi:MAG: asparaginase [Gemmatimonadetes bacterium]|nr:asparaginase [Gemmatimonadota bacterium]
MRAIAAMCALLGAAKLPAQNPAAAAAGKPQVHIVATGGTIASTNYYSANVGKIGVDALLAAVPALASIASVTGQQFSNVASGSITQDMWLRLSRGISDTLRARPELSGVVVTHGTDTIEETAYFLDLTVADPRPVIVTGAMRPSDGIGTDGPANLYNSVRVAGEPSARGRGTMLLLNDEIFAGRDVTKMNTVRPDAFGAPYRGALGIADPEHIVWHRSATRQPVFDIAGVRELPRVDIAYVYAGADGAAIDAFVVAGAKGIVVAGVGRGGTSPGIGAAMRRAMEKGVVVVIGSRTGSGSVPVGTGASRDGKGPAAVGSGDLPVQKARVLLTLALLRSTNPRDVASVFAAHQ